jgi:hypothetical protein
MCKNLEDNEKDERSYKTVKTLQPAKAKEKTGYDSTKPYEANSFSIRFWRTYIQLSISRLQNGLLSFIFGICNSF